MEIWILFSIANDYNQPDAAFKELFFHEPTTHDLIKYNIHDYDNNTIYWVEKFDKNKRFIENVMKTQNEYFDNNIKKEVILNDTEFEYEEIENHIKYKDFDKGIFALRSDTSKTFECFVKKEAKIYFGVGKKQIICLKEMKKKD